ncbi:MAG: chromate resistance protein ChrB domain-containing protein [Thermoplasmatota archaeon]
MLWVTRSRPHVDRCGTAWLIKRFIDPKAVFAFVEANEELPPKGEPFDLPNVRYGHRGSDCTFETALKEHKLTKDPGLRRMAEIIHDLDFHEGKRSESAGLDVILRGMKLAERDDGKVLEQSLIVFDALYAWARGRDV